MNDLTIYDFYLEHPPISNRGYPDRGSTARHAFWNGYNGSPAQGSPNSSARLAWKAGKQAKKQNNALCQSAAQKLHRND